MDRAQVTYADDGPRLVSVNLRPQPHEVLQQGKMQVTAIDKRPVEAAVTVRAPGDQRTGLGSGLVGDLIVDRKYHGGDHQAVYAYAREDLRHLGEAAGVDFQPGQFGENFTTSGLDVNGALIGERWRVGSDLVVQVTEPRIPCRTFRAWIGLRGWMKTFTASGLCGPYLSVVEPGEVRAGDAIEIIHRPDHDVAMWHLFRAMTTDPQRWAHILDVCDDLTPGSRALGEKKLAKL